MNYAVKTFTGLDVALKELEPFVRNGQHLLTGKPFLNFGEMRSREILANWLLCAAVNQIDGRELTFASDPIGGDGIICDRSTGETWPTEHVMVPPPPGGSGDTEALILAAIEQKRAKGGAAYAAGKTLIVFLEAGTGAWLPNKVARRLPDPLLFAAVWVVGLYVVRDGAYTYAVTALDISEGAAPACLVHVSQGFEAWAVERLQ